MMNIIFENKFTRYIIGQDGANLQFINKLDGIDRIASGPSTKCAQVKNGNKVCEASAVAYADGRLTIAFDRAGTMAIIKVTTKSRYFIFEVESVVGDFDELVFVNLPTALQVKADEPFVAGMLALNLQANVQELPGPQRYLWAACYRRFGFSGAQAGLVACPYREMREVLKEMVGNAPGVPHSPLGGPWAMDSEFPYGSYLTGAPTEQTVDSWIDLCRALGFTQIDFCNCLNYGDYRPFPDLYPDGYRSIKAVTDKLHAAGILAGLHTLSFSIDKRCAWVTPQPDPRLAKERSYTLARAIGADDALLPLIEPTVDLPEHIGFFIQRSKTLQIDNELIEYTTVQGAPTHAVAGCKRGALGTRPSAHARGAQVHHLKECWEYFLPDGDSTLFTEVAGRIAGVINECGFDFTYLDGLDGAHVIGGEQNRWYYGAKFAYEVYRHCHRPIMMEMATFHHHLWFIRSRMQAWDCAIRGHKTFIDLHCRSNDGCRRIFMPRHLGWVKLLASDDPNYEPTFDDDVEYMWCKGLGTDAGCSLVFLSPEMLISEPWLRHMVPIIKTYESLRKRNYLSASLKRALRAPGAEFTLISSAEGEQQFLPVRYARHKVEIDVQATAAWRTVNPFGCQPLRVRIQALMSAGPYDAPGNIVLADFTAPGEFTDRGVTETILNSGKVYSYPSAAPGLSADICPVRDPARSAAFSGCWTATNAGSGDHVCSSAPDDEFSLEDHAERFYRPRQACWIRAAKHFLPGLDLSSRRGIGVWIYGDNQGELINIQLGSIKEIQNVLDHYVRIDFAGWQYVELIEPESARFEKLSWPYGRCLYGAYRKQLNIKDVNTLCLWYNDVPVGRKVTCYLSPIKALPLIKTRIKRPRLTVNGRTLLFPVEIESGNYLEFEGRDQCQIYGPKRELLGMVRPEGEIPGLLPGANEIAFQCDPSPLRVRAQVAIISRGDTPLRP